MHVNRKRALGQFDWTNSKVSHKIHTRGVELYIQLPFHYVCSTLKELERTSNFSSLINNAFCGCTRPPTSESNELKYSKGWVFRLRDGQNQPLNSPGCREIYHTRAAKLYDKCGTDERQLCCIRYDQTVKCIIYLDICMRISFHGIVLLKCYRLFKAAVWSVEL